MADRIPCCIPFCRRTAAKAKHPGCTEIICAPCGRRVPEARRIYRRAQREVDRARERAGAALTISDCEVIRRASARQDRLWSAFRRRAIEAAAGIGGARG